jgi:hypothetical protein
MPYLTSSFSIACVYSINAVIIQELNIYLSTFLLALQPCVGLGLLHGFITANFSEMRSLPHAHLPTWMTRDYTSSGLYPLTYLVWVDTPRAYSLTTIALWVIVAHKPPIHNKAEILKEDIPV